jgi:hypothetical protein
MGEQKRGKGVQIHRMIERLLPKHYLEMNPNTGLVMAVFSSGLSGLAIRLVFDGQLVFAPAAIIMSWITFHSAYISYAIRRDRRKHAD